MRKQGSPEYQAARLPENLGPMHRTGPFFHNDRMNHSTRPPAIAQAASQAARASGIRNQAQAQAASMRHPCQVILATLAPAMFPRRSHPGDATAWQTV
jgi:hypothetical protein